MVDDVGYVCGLDTHVQTMSNLKLFLLAVLVAAVCSDKILAILDSRDLQKTHSTFFSLLTQGGQHQVEFAHSFGKSNIELKYYDRFRYDHIVVFCTSDKEIDSRIKTRDIISYFDEGGNVIVVGDVDTSFSYRKLFYAFGVELDEAGSQLKDHFSHHNSSSLISTGNYEPVSPFFTPSHSRKPLLYKGVGLALVNYENYQLYNLVKAEATTFSKNYKNNQPIRAGTAITLLAGVQGLNNARAILAGSLHFFSNELLGVGEFGNKAAVEDLLRWVLKKKGMVRVKSMSYHGEGVEHKETLFNVGEKLYFSAEIEEYTAESDSWRPYVADDLQVELVMLDPWVRTTLVKGQGSTYLAEFYAPLKEGIYQFKINYKKAGFNFIKEAERVTIRPYKHDEFERFLFVAYPYFFGAFSTIIGTFIFIVLYLYSGSKVKTD